MMLACGKILPGSKFSSYRQFLQSLPFTVAHYLGPEDVSCFLRQMVIEHGLAQPKQLCGILLR